MSSNDADNPISNDWSPEGLHHSMSSYVFALGVLDKNWRQAERYLEAMIWDLLRVDRKVGEAVTTHVGNVTRTEILKSLSAILLKPDEHELVTDGVAAFNAARENRNLLTHALLGHADNAGVTLFRITARGEVKHETLKAPLAHIRRIADGIFFMRLRLGIRPDVPQPLPDKPARPESLLTLLRQDQQTG